MNEVAGLSKKRSSLIDTGFLYAILDKSDARHEMCVAALENEPDRLLPEVVLPELAYLVLRQSNYSGLSRFLRSIAAGEFELVKTEIPDLERAAEILEKYADSKIDFVDAVIMAIAERLNIERILTVDRRDFGLFRPRHCDHFEIVP